MEFFRSKLYYIDKDSDDIETNMLEDVSNTINRDIDNEDIVIVTKSEDENYVREISTGLLLPIIEGDKLVYRDEYVDSHYRRWRSERVKKTSVPAHIIAFRDNLCKSSYGVPSLDDYCDKVLYSSMAPYLERYKDRNERYHYLCRRLYSKDNQDDFTLEDSQEYRKNFNFMLRKRYSIFSGDVFCPYPSNETFSVMTSFLEDNQILPLEVPIDSFDEFGVFLFRQLKFRDFTFNDTMVEKLYVTLSENNTLKEIRTKEEIPYVYYQLNEDETKARLMVNGHQASPDDVISYFTFMPFSNEEVHNVSKADIREYRKYYINFDTVLHSYTEHNQVGFGKSTLKKQSSSPVVEIEVEQDKVSDSSISPLTFTDSSFSNQSNIGLDFSISTYISKLESLEQNIDEITRKTIDNSRYNLDSFVDFLKNLSNLSDSNERMKVLYQEMAYLSRIPITSSLEEQLVIVDQFVETAIENFCLLPLEQREKYWNPLDSNYQVEFISRLEREVFDNDVLQGRKYFDVSASEHTFSYFNELIDRRIKLCSNTKNTVK